ncbi:hypothetical protein BT96DRAFT_1003117 [Gymnopus androsaceus JB14]|uniref:Uncharacterized protein n=1 Tax=Gymnopus androsaceus JB14 TaxID=1447944 RepID=A0A6A4GWV8_9AGAR|nr:hypothetical protein BT96DRAFT_1003117 [Gymnopus androsaceus JB14]
MSRKLINGNERAKDFEGRKSRNTRAHDATCLVDNILKRFVTFHLVKRYPLVFGTQLDVEMPFFPSIFRSILEMAKRSPNPAFRARFKQLIKVIHEATAPNCFTASSAALATYLDGSGEPNDAELPEISSETALCLSTEKLFCIGMKRPFKTTTGLPMTQADTQDNDELSRDHSAGASTAPQTDGEDLLWKDPAGGLMNMDMDDPNPRV